jgi:hypothetical protein
MALQPAAEMLLIRPIGGVTRARRAGVGSARRRIRTIWCITRLRIGWPRRVAGRHVAIPGRSTELRRLRIARCGPRPRRILRRVVLGRIVLRHARRCGRTRSRGARCGHVRCGRRLASRMIAAMLGAGRKSGDEGGHRKKECGDRRASRTGNSSCGARRAAYSRGNTAGSAHAATCCCALLSCCALLNHGVLSFLITCLGLLWLPVPLTSLWFSPGSVLQPGCPRSTAASSLVRR